MTGSIKSDRLVTRVVAVILSALVALSMMFAFGGTSANAVTVLTTNGGKSLNSLLTADISGYSSHFSEYNIKKLAQKFDFKSKGKGGELRNDQVFIIQNNKKFTFKGEVFEDIDDSSLQQDLIRCFAKEMTKKSVYSFSDSDRQAIYNEIKDGCGPANAAMVAALFSDTKADMFSALNIFAPFNGIIGTLLGIGVLVIIVLLIASTAMDIAYINFPVARNFMYGKDDKGGGGGDSKSSKPWGVTADAWSVVNECEAGGDKGYKNANIAYFKRRALTYIVVSILILYLLSGQIAGLIAWLMKLVSGFKIN